MKKAIELGKKARLLSPPNPWVGAIIVKKDKVVGIGFTQAPGNDHAEIVALKQAKDNAKGATLFVTLEPCSHFGKTPPCTDAILAAGVSKVVIGIADPDHKVAGNGLLALQKGGVETVVGVLEKEITSELLPYLHHRKTGLPFVIAKIGMSMDGKLTDSLGASKWITSESARIQVHALRAASQAVIIGSGTYLADHPQLNVRHPPLPYKQPLRVVVDRRGRITDTTFDIHFKQNNLQLLLKELGDRGVVQAMIEGGSTLLNSFLKENLVDHLYTHINGRIFGGGTALSALDFIHSPTRFYPIFTSFFGDTLEVLWSSRKKIVSNRG